MIQKQSSHAERLTIRPVRPDDLAPLHALRRRPEIAQHLLLLPSEELTMVRGELEQADLWTTRLVAEYDGVVAGYGSLAVRPRPRFSHAGELIFFVRPELHHRGVGHALLSALLDSADNWYRLVRVAARAFTFSTDALSLLAEHGFVREAMLRQYAMAGGQLHDVALMVRLHGVDPDVRDQAQVPVPPAAQPPQYAMAPTEVGDPFIRPFDPQDIPDVHVFITNPAVARFTGQMPGTEEVFLDQKLTPTRPGLHRYVAEAEGRAVGLATLYVDQHPRRVHAGGIGMSVHRAFWGRGLGTQLMAALCDLADNWLGLRRLELNVNVDNSTAIRLYERFGFAHEGLLRYHLYGDGRWAHSYVMGRVR